MIRLPLAPTGWPHAIAPLPATAADREVAGAVATLNDPATQERMADTVTALVAALMQMPVGPLADAVAQFAGSRGRELMNVAGLISMFGF